MNLGELRIDAVADGTAKLPPAYFPNADWGPHQQLIGPDGMVDISLGCFLVRAGDRTVLIDAGIGPVDGPIFQGGQLPERLKEVGAVPEDIDTIICTHLHIDHVGWLVRDEKPFFPNATVHFGQADWKQFVTDVPASDMTRKAMEVLDAAGRAAPVEGDTEVAPGICTRDAPGHTHGHICVVLSSGKERALLLGDAVTCPVQLAEPDWQAMSDVDPELAKRTRECLWRELEGTDNVAVAAHFPDLRFGRILRGQGKRYFA